MKKNTDLNKFYDFKVNHCDKFFSKNVDIWSNRILIECMDDEDLLEELKKYIDIDNNISSENLNNMMQELRNKTNEYIHNCENKSDDELFYNFNRALVYYGLLESLDELASFAINLIESIKEKYGDYYLDVISQFDKGNLSVDGAKVMNESKFENINYDDELLKKYLVLKIWQDKQHGYYQTIIEPLLMKLTDLYMDSHPLPVDVEIEDLFVYKKFYELCNKEIIDIDELVKCYLCGMDNELIKLVGGKAYGLTVLKANNISIPNSYVIPVTNENISDEIFNKFNNENNYSVRSSADVEDGQKNSFAGMFDSYLNVSKEELRENTLKVISSKNNSRVKEYVEKNNLEKPNMAVVIQKFVEPEYAGVWIGKNEKSGYLEYVEGNGEKLVSGSVTPNREIWENNECKDNKLKCIDGEIGKKLLEYQNSIVKEKGEVADFEWMILNNHLVMLQYRPVTSKVNIMQDVNVDDSIIRGIPSSPGKVSAPARFINARLIDQVNDWHEGDILLSWYTDPEWMHILSKSSGIVTAVGGFLCHAAIIARELGIPCVIGIGPDAMKKIWNEDYLTIDGDKGTIEVVKVKKNNQ